MVTFGPHVLLSFFCAEPLTVFALHGQSVLLFVYGSASICICLGLDRALPSSHVYIIGHPIAGVPLRRPLPAGANDLLLPTALPSCARYTAFSLYLQRELIEFSRLCGAPGVIRTRDPLLRSRMTTFGDSDEVDQHSAVMPISVPG